MNQNLAIIFGATGGVGSASARELHHQGWNLLLVGRTDDDLKALAGELNCPYQIADVTQSTDVERVFEDAKAGIVGLTKSAAATYAKQGIRINTISPGLLDTKLAQRITKNSANLAASDQSWITGQTIGMDGGLASLKT